MLFVCLFIYLLSVFYFPPSKKKTGKNDKNDWGKCLGLHFTSYGPATVISLHFSDESCEESKEILLKMRLFLAMLLCYFVSFLFSVFMWRSHIAKVKITFPSEVLVLSDIRPFTNLTFYNVLARQGSSFCKRARLNFQAFALRDINWRPEKAVAWVKRWVIALVFANWTVLTLEEVLISTCRSSRVITFGFNSKTQWQMFLLLDGRHVCAPPRGTNMASPYKVL